MDIKKKNEKMINKRIETVCVEVLKYNVFVWQKRNQMYWQWILRVFGADA